MAFKEKIIEVFASTKQKYLELLEEYKMELTEKYIENGYLYDNFLGIN